MKILNKNTLKKTALISIMTLLALGGILQATTVSAGVPTASFGTTSVGGLSSTLYYLTPRATQYTPGSSGTVTDIMLYLTGTGHAQVAIYADSGNAPGALLAKSSSDAISSNGWHDFSGFNVAVTGGVPYWLAAEADGPNLRWYYNDGGANEYAGGGGFSYGTFPNPFIRSSPVPGNYMTSIYAIYTPQSTQSSAPTAAFGTTSVGGLSATLYYLTPRATQYTPGSSGTVTDIMLYLTGTGHAQVAIYADSGNAPGALLAKSSSDAISSNGWHDFSGFNVAVTGGVPYWLAAEADGPNLRWYYNNGGANLCAGGGGFSYGTFPNPYIRSSSGNYMTSIYAIYTPQSTQSSAPTAAFANNLVPIPSWGAYENYPQAFTTNVHFDTNALYNGEESIRIDPPANIYANPAREANALNGAIIPVHAGDHIVFNCWIKTTSSQNPANNNNPATGGGRIGIEFIYGNYVVATAISNGVLSRPIANYDSVTTVSGDPQFRGSFVSWNTGTWTLQTVDCVVPSGLGIAGMIPWMQVLGATDWGVAWFANSALYVNP